MSTLTNWLKCLVGKRCFWRSQPFTNIRSQHVRNFTDTPDASSKQIMVQGTENEARLRVRRARPADAPRVLRFVREYARAAWPGLASPPSAPQLVLCDYVARALAQGHSMLAEQQEVRRGLSNIRGLALSVAVCPWDASMLERWARTLRCARGRRLVGFTAHCLRAPALHHKYRVQKILQVMMIVPKDNLKNAEIINILAKNAIKRGNEVGFPLIRFDVTCDHIGKTLEELQLKKEWQLSYDVLPESTKNIDITLNSKDSVTDKEVGLKESIENKTTKPTYKHTIAVYTKLMKADVAPVEAK